ncbi:MAG: hypothetical protein KAU50_09805 [Candidatus Marinimicrobia bacterium]|nr:hypothetical protein [Candidatus Neomarinimicrobiota bacterium]
MDNQVISSIDGNLLSLAGILFLVSLVFFIFILYRLIKMEERWSFVKSWIHDRTTKSTSFHDKQIEVLSDLAGRLTDGFENLMAYLDTGRGTSRFGADYKQQFEAIEHLSNYYHSVEFFVTEEILRKSLKEYFRESNEAILYRMSSEESGRGNWDDSMNLAIEVITEHHERLQERITGCVREIEVPGAAAA